MRSSWHNYSSYLTYLDWVDHSSKPAAYHQMLGRIVLRILYITRSRINDIADEERASQDAGYTYVQYDNSCGAQIRYTASSTRRVPCEP